MKPVFIVSFLATAICLAACGDDDETQSNEPDAAATDSETTDEEPTDEATDGTEASDVADTEASSESDAVDATDVEVTDEASTDSEADEPDAGVTPEPEPAGFIGAEGGTIENDEGVMLVVPPNSIDPPSAITLGEVEVDNPELLVSPAWDFQPDGVTFDPPALLTIPFDPDAAGDAELAIAWLDAGEWMPLLECSLGDGSVTCEVEHFTTFGVVTLDGDSPDAGMDATDGTDTMATDVVTDGTDTMMTDVTDPVMTDMATDGTDTGGTDVGTTCEAPPCWTSIDIAECTPDVADTCQTNIEDLTPVSTNVCYANGVKAQVTGLTSEPLVMNFKKPNGDACYSLEFTGALTATYNYVWKDATGTPVMTATVQAANPDVITYQCDGAEYVVDYSTEACMSEPGPANSDSTGCTMGTCAF